MRQKTSFNAPWRRFNKSPKSVGGNQTRFSSLSSFLSLSSVSSAQTVELDAHLHGNRGMFKEGLSGFTQLNAHRFTVWSDSHLISLSSGKTTFYRRAKVSSKIRSLCNSAHMPTLCKMLFVLNLVVNLFLLWSIQNARATQETCRNDTLSLRSQCWRHTDVSCSSYDTCLNYVLWMTCKDCCEWYGSVSKEKFVLDS